MAPYIFGRKYTFSIGFSQLKITYAVALWYAIFIINLVLETQARNCDIGDSIPIYLPIRPEDRQR